MKQLMLPMWLGTLLVGLLGLGSMALAAPLAYITNQLSNDVSVLDTATNTVVATIPVGSAPRGVAVHPAGTFVYVANNGSGTVSVLDTATNTVIATVTVGDAPVAFGQFITPEPCPDCLIDAGLVVGTGEAGPGDTVTIPVEVLNAPNEVNALGFSVLFPLANLQFAGCDFSGTLLATWADRNCAERPGGIVRVGGLTVFDAIPAGGPWHPREHHLPGGRLCGMAGIAAAAGESGGRCGPVCHLCGLLHLCDLQQRRYRSR